MAEGKRNREIADALFLSEKTVKNYISSILFKLQVNSRTEAALLAVKRGLI
jgi:Response regulator containing a CheY-like receiver domain and an HTH DNA-binding domain